MKSFLAFLLIVVFAASAVAQWSFVKVFPDTSLSWPSGINNGIAVDPAGKIWMQSFSGGVDSFDLGGGKYKLHGVIRVYNRNGTEVSFSPMKTITVSSVTDTITGSGYGLAVDPDGNILSLKPSNTLYRIDYKTGAGMKKVVSPIPGYTSSMVTPAVDSLGEIFLGPVLPGYASVILNPDFTSAGTTIEDTVLGFGRCIAVSKNGNEVYIPRFDKRNATHYHSDNGSFGPYAIQDTVLKGLVIETSVWDKKGNLWVTGGNVVSGVPDPPYTAYSWYAWNPTTKQIVDSINWDYTGITRDSLLKLDPRPRGIAFSVTGDTAYVAAFNVSKRFLQMFKRGPAGVRREPDVVVNDYSLSQNYPNPFNPSTQIRFTLAKAGLTTLKVYNTLGQEIATLVNENLSAGSYTTTFDGARLSSGTYLYVLTSGNQRLTNKMMLLK